MKTFFPIIIVFLTVCSIVVKAQTDSASADSNLIKGLDAFEQKNYEQAYTYLLKSAEAGNAEAQYKVGYMYATGDGIEKDYIQSVKWYQKAAEQGDAEAQNNLAALYFNGEGVKQNEIKAIEWFQKAADQGYTDAQDNLKKLKEAYGYVPKLRSDLTETDKLNIRKKATECFPIEGQVAFFISTEDLLPADSRTQEEPANMKRVKELLKLAQTHPESFSVYLSLAKTYLKLHKKEEGYDAQEKAKTIVQKDLQTNPDSNALYINLGLVYTIEENYRKACAHVKSQLSATRTNALRSGTNSGTHFLLSKNAQRKKTLGEFFNL